MDIRTFRYFESVARNQQFTLASEELHISQPSLSNSIKSLEREVGCKLFERSTRKVNLTESGQVLYKHACKLLNQFDNVFKEMEDVRNIGAGKLNLGMIESFRYLIPEIISQFKDTYPSISINIREMSPNEIEYSLNNYDIHLGITSNCNKNNEIEYIPIFNEKLVLITPLDHHLIHLSSIDISELKNEILIHSLTGYKVRESIIMACKDAGFIPKVDYETESLETARGLVEIGLGVSVVPESYLKLNPSKKIKIIYLKNHLPNRTVYISYQYQRYLPPAFFDFISIANLFSNERIS